MGGGRRGGRAFVNLVLVKAAGRLYFSDAVRAARQEARVRSRPGARVEGGDEASPRGRCSERRSRRGPERAQDTSPRRGLDDARRLREPSEARSIDFVVLHYKWCNLGADIRWKRVDAEPRDAVHHRRVRAVRGS